MAPGILRESSLKALIFAVAVNPLSILFQNSSAPLAEDIDPEVRPQLPSTSWEQILVGP